MNSLTCFKAYDVRGKLGEELNEEIAYRIGRAYAQVLNAKKVVVGGDVRLTSESLKLSLAQGLMDAGVDVIDIGLTGTEEVYFAAFTLDVDGGIEVTASHNPMDYNGMKFVGRGAKPISRDNGLTEIQKLAESQAFEAVKQKGKIIKQSILHSYVQHLLTYVDWQNFKPMKIVVNAGNGAAGHVIDAIEAEFNSKNVPVAFVKVNHEPNGHFPRGIPNPLLPECRQDTIDAVLAHKADMGIAWDGDFDRCFFFDHEGSFIEGYYIVGLLAQSILAKHPGEKIIYDPRLTWNTESVVAGAGGVAVMSKTGHAFIKQQMRLHNAVYGGEMSAHHYFRDFAYCDSGMLPWLLIIELLSQSGESLKSMVSKRIDLYPCSGELNFDVHDLEKIIATLESDCAVNSGKITKLDGLSIEFDDWRMNVRLSNTEPLLRLNVESRANPELLAKKTLWLTDLIDGNT